MKVFRLARKKYGTALSGKGAAIKGARWNSTGVEVIYTAENRSLAMAEVAVHLTLATLPSDYMMLTILIPDNLSIAKIKIQDLPNNWNIFPQFDITKKMGDTFIAERKHIVLKVPSVVTKGDHNYLINPYHSDFKKVKVIDASPFPFDQRIFK